MRYDNRSAHALREIAIQRHYTCHAEGSVLISYGRTKVLCTASVMPGVPSFLKGSGRGWVTAEYSMLPRATSERKRRESSTGRADGRSMEIQRLIGRSLRSAIIAEQLGEMQIIVDCDVLQADGGTRTAAITGSYIALVDALSALTSKKNLVQNALHFQVAAVSVGVCDGAVFLDLDAREDVRTETDMNVVMSSTGEFIEIQGTAEKRPFSTANLTEMLEFARQGINELFTLQKKALAD